MRVSRAVLVLKRVRLAVRSAAQKTAADLARVQGATSSGRVSPGCPRVVGGRGRGASGTRRSATLPPRRQQTRLDVEPEVEATRVKVAAHRSAGCTKPITSCRNQGTYRSSVYS